VSARHAIYFVPADDSPLAMFGNRILGRDAEANKLQSSSDDHPLRESLSKTVQRYGFHATLKAPFELRADKNRAQLCDAMATFAETLAPVSLNGLKPRRLDRHLVLMCDKDAAPLKTLAERCVREFETFRAPMLSSDRRRREFAGMSSRQKQNLEKFAYAHVLADFRFHMTLAGPVSASTGGADPDSAAIESYLDWLTSLYSVQITQAPVLDRLVLSYQKDRRSDFSRLAEWTLKKT